MSLTKWIACALVLPLLSGCTLEKTPSHEDKVAESAGHWVRAFEYCDFINNEDQRCEALDQYATSSFSFSESWRAIDINSEGTLMQLTSPEEAISSENRVLGQIVSVEGHRRHVRLVDPQWTENTMVMDFSSQFLNIVTLESKNGSRTRVPYMKVTVRDANAFTIFCRTIDCKGRAVSKISSQQTQEDRLAKEP